MFDLTRQEKTILIFLALSFATGAGINFYKKSQGKKELTVRPYKMAARQDADKFIARHAFININSAQLDELMRLPGIGEKIARRIMKYREEYGGFSAREELLRVRGIGARKLEALMDLVVLE